MIARDCRPRDRVADRDSQWRSSIYRQAAIESTPLFIGRPLRCEHRASDSLGEHMVKAHTKDAG